LILDYPWSRHHRADTKETLRMTSSDFSKQLAGFSLTTAEILYHLPDHPVLLQTYIWQDYDLHPRFPKLKAFLDFWSSNLDGKLFRVTVANKKLIAPAELTYAKCMVAWN
jgi:uncharacterized protein Usg